MAAKQLGYDREAMDAIRTGVAILTQAVKSTLGPKGRNAVLDKGWGSPTVTKDGVTVAEEIELEDKFQNMAVQLVKQAASKTSDVAGDGTTTATVLTEAIFLEGMKLIIAGADAMSIKRGIRTAVDTVIETLKTMNRKVSDKKEISQVGSIASNNDFEIGRMLAEAMEKVGKDGVITVEESKSLDTDVEVVEGMQFDRGYLSPHFVTDADSMKVELRDCYILIHEEKLSNIQDMIPLFEMMAKEKKPLLIIAEDVEGDALATMVVNKLRGILECVAVKAPGYGDRRTAMLGDISILTGANAITKDLGHDLKDTQLSDLGQARRVLIDADNTTIVEGSGNSPAIQGRIRQIRDEIETNTSDYDREKLQERLAKLSGGVAQINVGAATESDMKEKKARVEDALHSVRAAVEEGVLPGGGVALLRAAASIDGLKLKGDEELGATLVKKALQAPIRGIAENAGVNGAIVVKKVLEGKDGFGYNALTNTYEDLFHAGVIDPMKVVRTALENATSVASVLLTTGCMVCEIPQEEAAGGHDHHHHDEMGGMGGMGDMGGGMGGMGDMGGGMGGMGDMGGMGGMM